MLKLQKQHYDKIKNHSLSTLCLNYGKWKTNNDIEEDWDDTLDYMEDIFNEYRLKKTFIEFLIDISVGRYSTTNDQIIYIVRDEAE